MRVRNNIDTVPKPGDKVWEDQIKHYGTILEIIYDLYRTSYKVKFPNYTTVIDESYLELIPNPQEFTNLKPKQYEERIALNWIPTVYRSPFLYDEHGKVLSRQGDSASGASNDMMDLKRKIEKDLEDRIESILSKVVGAGKIVARVDATINQKMI